MQKQEILFLQLWSKRPDLDSSSLVQWSCGREHSTSFELPKKSMTGVCHLSVLSEMEILVQRMIFVKEEAAFMHFCKEREKLRRDIYIWQCKVFCWVLMCLFPFFFWKGVKQNIWKGGYKVCNSSHSSVGRSRWDHRKWQACKSWNM